MRWVPVSKPLKPENERQFEAWNVTWWSCPCGAIYSGLPESCSGCGDVSPLVDAEIAAS